MRNALEAALSWWESVGVETPDIQPPKPRARTVSASTKVQSQPTNRVETRPPQTTDTPSLGLQQIQKMAADAQTLEALKATIHNMDAGLLSGHAQNVVFSRGKGNAKVMIIGEAPGREEDIQGKPFVGEAGQLLDRMLGAIGLTETDIYITNIVNWRPPGNRTPTPDEMTLCRPIIDRHIALFDPKIIMLVGGVALAALTDDTGIMKNRGQWKNLNVNGHDVPALPIFHPAFLLRRPELKKDAWRDLLSFRARLEDLALVGTELASQT